jgi:beta-lactamase regulating signal transducer with metallopeptidase domain
MTIDMMFGLLADLSWRAVAIVCVTAGLLRLLRVRDGATQHRAWTLALCAISLLPLFAVLPRVGVGLPAWAWPTGATRTAHTLLRAPAAAVPESRTDATGAVVPLGTASREVAPGADDRGGTAPSVAPAVEWREAVVLVWLMGVAIAGTRLMAGARRVTAAAASAHAHPDGVWISPKVRTPVVIGARHPRILVPSSWEQWSKTTRALVMAHERAHVRRRDGAWALMAQVVKVVGWCHPAVWWLERALSAAAERACDDEVLRAGHAPGAYAALLVGMASGVRAGGRLDWAAAHMARPQGFTARVERVLGGAVPPSSRAQQWRVAIAAGALLSASVACERAAAPLEPDPAVTAAMEREQARMEAYKAAASLTRAEVDALAAHVARNPDDLDAANRLLSFYQQGGQAMLGWSGLLDARRALLLPLIERHPESGLTPWNTDRKYDEAGWSQAAAIWRRHVASADASPRVLGNAARFFEREEPETAEGLLLRALAHESTPWRDRLASLYATALVGAQRGATNTFQALSRVRAESSFGRRVRATLDASTDGRLLASVGETLLREFKGRDDTAALELGFSPMAHGAELVTRGLALVPDQPRAARQLLGYERHWQWGAPLQNMSPADWVRAAADVPATVPEEVAAYRIADAADHAWSLDSDVDVQALVGRLESIAGQAHARTHLRYAAAMVQAGVAIRRGDRAEAVRRLREATRLVQASTASLEGLVPMARQRVSWTLLDAGEREVVAEYFQALHARMSADSPYGAAADAIRAGRMPAEYQRYRASEYNRATAAKK